MRTLPDCPCGGYLFQPGGSSISSQLLSANHTCVSKGCDMRLWELATNVGSVVLFLKNGDAAQAAVANEWVNKILLVTWRDRTSKLKVFGTLEWRTWLDTVFKPTFPEIKVSDDYCLSYSELPSEAKAAMDGVFGENQEKRGRYLPMPPELKEDIYPPQVPKELDHVYFRRSANFEWQEVVHARSAEVVPPRDPILVSNENFFARVWPAVENELGWKLPQRAEAKNEYGGIEPWYTFTLNEVVFVVGWRKRVINIDVVAPFLLPTKNILELTSIDNTTYSSDGVWKNDIKVARQINVHAWGEQKLVEYLTILCKIVLENT